MTGPAMFSATMVKRVQQFQRRCLDSSRQTLSASPRVSDGHAFKSNRWEEYVKMPGKMAGPDPRPLFAVTRGAGQLSEPRFPVAESWKNANIHASSEVIRGIPLEFNRLEFNRLAKLRAACRIPAAAPCRQHAD
jgi:hypothetical protein